MLLDDLKRKYLSGPKSPAQKDQEERLRACDMSSGPPAAGSLYHDGFVLTNYSKDHHPTSVAFHGVDHTKTETFHSNKKSKTKEDPTSFCRPSLADMCTLCSKAGPTTARPPLISENREIVGPPGKPFASHQNLE